jgi:predicted Rossmann-fold nucleotide-binding protein
LATSTHQRPHIVAVFGGNHVEDPVAEKARTTAGQIVARGAIVLTGGDGRSNKTQNVKDVANVRARSAGRWISVLNTRRGQPRDLSRVDRGAIVRPQTGDQRNLLEAWMSDACVVLTTGAGDGTFSELVSGLCLGRPILLVGEPAMWSTHRPWSQVRDWFESGHVDGSSAEEITRQVRDYLGEGAITDLVRATLKAENLGVDRTCAFLGPDEDAAAGRWIADRVAAGQVGEFPTIDSTDVAVRAEFRAMTSAYRQWLTE